MKFEDIILQYLKDDKQAMKDLLTLFLNAVLQQEAEIQVVCLTKEVIREKLIATVIGNVL